MSKFAVTLYALFAVFASFAAPFTEGGVTYTPNDEVTRRQPIVTGVNVTGMVESVSYTKDEVDRRIATDSPVKSVNGMRGDVKLGAREVGALPDNRAYLEDDANFVNAVRNVQVNGGGVDTNAVRDIVREEVPDYETTSNRAAAACAATNDYLRTSGGEVRGTLKMAKTYDTYISETLIFENEGFRSPTMVGEAGQLLVDADLISLPGINSYGNSYFQGNFTLNGRFRSIQEHSLLDYNVTNTVVEINNQAQGIVSTNANDNIATIVFGSASRFTRIGGSSIDLFGGSTYVNGDLKPNRTVQMTPEQFRFTNRGNMNLIELIESYIRAKDGSGLSVTDPSYSFANQDHTATLSAPHIPTEDNSVVTSQGTLTYDGTNYWLNGETQYYRDVAGDVKASVTLDQQMLTNVVTAVKSHHYDETLEVTWRQVIDDGHIYFIAVTNANVVAQ